MNTQEILSTIIVAFIVLTVYYLATFHRNKHQKELKKMQNSLKKGDKIITFSGLAGIIEQVLEDRVIISTYPENVRISVEKWAVAGIDDREIK